MSAIIWRQVENRLLGATEAWAGYVGVESHATHRYDLTQNSRGDWLIEYWPDRLVPERVGMTTSREAAMRSAERHHERTTSNG